jgi:sulfatase maturation enzyme AslB (radical SAM superfamily)
MDLALYRKVIDDAVAFGTRSVYLLFMGEPLLHKGIVEMVSVAHNRGLETHIFTNGQLLTEGLFGGLGVAGLDELRFSVDGATAATYERNRVGGHFDRVLANMKMAAQVARERGFRTRLVWQFIAMRNNESEIEDGRRMAAEIGVNFVVKTFAETDPDRAPLNSGLRRVRRPKPCQDIYRNVYVLWNGDVVLCCYDQNGTHVVGNLERETLTAVWNGPRCLSLRRRIGRAIREPANEPAFCRQCAKWTR